MNMDDTVEEKHLLAMAKAMYLGLRGLQVDQETRDLSVVYSVYLFSSPWVDLTDTRTKAYSRRFFDAIRNMGKTTNMVARWRDHFNEHDLPRTADLAHAFIAEFFRLHLHYPRDYHDFVCQRRVVAHNRVLDFPIEHPISVEFWAIYITISGSATLTLGTESIHLAPNSIAIISPGCRCTISRAEDSDHWSYDWLSFRSRMEWIELLEWATELTRPVVFSVEEPGFFDSLCQQTERLESTPYIRGDLSERLCNNIIENILLSIRIFAEETDTGTTPTNRKVQSAVNYILNHYGEEITLEMIAASANSSPGRLSALFREQFGISVINWRDQIRMQRACELISHTQGSISSIAGRVGYKDPLYFSRRFKEHYGVAPSHFRKN